MSVALVSLHVAVAHPGGSVHPTLEGLRTQTDTRCEVVLIDNACQDRPVLWSQGNGPKFMTLRNFRDQGFVRAHNQAIASLLARVPKETHDRCWVGILSSRVVLAPDCVAALLHTIAAHPDTTVCAPKIRAIHLETQDDRDDPTFVDTGMIVEAGRVLSKNLALIPRGEGERDVGQYDAVDEGVFPGTLCLFVRVDALERANIGHGWLDIDLPETYAVADLLWRLERLGEPRMYIPHALAWTQYAAVSSLGLFARVRRWYSQEAVRVRLIKRYAAVVRIKNATWSQLFWATPRIVFFACFYRVRRCVEPSSSSAQTPSLRVFWRAWRARRSLQLAARASRR